MRTERVVVSVKIYFVSFSFQLHGEAVFDSHIKDFAYHSQIKL
jgi:hypothetical protein